MQPECGTIERDGEAFAVGVDVIRLRGGFGGGVRVLEPVRRLVQPRRDDAAADEGEEREASGDMAEARRHGRSVERKDSAWVAEPPNEPFAC